MDRIAHGSVSRSTASTNDNANDPHSSEHSGLSVFAKASAFIGTRARMALGAPPSIASTGPSGNPPRQMFANLSEEFFQATTSADEALLQFTDNDELGDIKIKALPNGCFNLSLPKSLTDCLLDNFVSVQSLSIDLSRVTGVNLSFCKKLTGAALGVLSQKFPALNNLDLTGCTQLNDSDLLHLANMLKLKNLSLAGCHGISKTGLVYLSNMIDNVEVLDLMNCPQVDDEIMACLPNMHQLKHLILTACTQFTNTGLRELRKLDKLESLILDQCTQISDAGLGNLHSSSKFRNLKEINLRYCPLITSKGVLALKKTLNTLKLVNTDVSLRKIAAAN